MKDLILIFLPGKKIRGECNEQENSQQEKNGPRDLMGTFILDDLPGGDPGFLFSLQFA